MQQRSVNWNPNEGDWGQLTDEALLSERREKAEEKLQDLTNDQIQYLRRRCKTDLFFLANGPLEYDLLSPGLHGSYARWLEKTRATNRFRLQLLPRGHYKSTIGTITESVQLALPTDGLELPYPWDLGTAIKILIAHENRESASRFLFEIVEAFMSKPIMLALYPECIPSKRKQRLNKWEVELPRRSYSKEPTFDTIGVGGAAQGRHYNRLKLDDLVGENARDSETVMRGVLDWFDNIMSLTTRFKIDGWDLIGTRWSALDVYGHALKNLGIDRESSFIKIAHQDYDDGLIATYIRGAIENGEPIFPEEFDLDTLNIVRKNRKVWAAQYANNPKESGLTTFNPNWLKYYNVKGSNIYVFEKNGVSTRKLSVWDLERFIMVDPSMGETDRADESGLIVTGVDKDFNIYILETVKLRITPPELIEMMFRLYTKWRPKWISMEEVIFSAVFKYWFQRECIRRGVNPSIYPYKPGGKRSKIARIEGLTTYFAAGQVYLLEGMHDFRDEYEWFPLGESEHLLDALAQGPELWIPAKMQEQHSDYAAAEKEILEMRDAETGY